MAELTADVVISKVKRGEKIDRADLSGINLTNALLEFLDKHIGAGANGAAPVQ